MKNQPTIKAHELVAAVWDAARGEALFGAGIAGRMLDVFGRSDNAVVARRLGVSGKTVRNNVSNTIAILRARDAGPGGG